MPRSINFKSSVRNVPFAAFLFILALPEVLLAQVASQDVSLQGIQTGNIPVITAITAYSTSESNAAAANAQAPIFYPYNPNITTNGFQSNDAWWDNLVMEQIQARLPVVMLSTAGCYTTNPADLTGPGNMNPRRLSSYINALQRAGAANGVIKLGCFAEAATGSIYDSYYGTPGALVDLSNQDSWNQIWWQRIIKPWFDTIPSNLWYTIGGKVPIEFWGLNLTTEYTNQQGNISQLFNYIAAQMYATYGVYSCFIMGSLNCDTTLSSCSYMLGDNEWFGPPAGCYSMTAYKGSVWGGLVAGYTNPNYYVSGNSAYQNPNTIIVRTGISGKGVTGQNGDTLRDGLDAAVSNNSIFNIIEGYTDISESCGMYRSQDVDWDYPNQYLNILASYTDLRTVTQRLLAVACDEDNATTGNLGGAFLRPGSAGGISVRALSGAPAITASAQQSQYAHYAACAFDGELNDMWYTGVSGMGWLEYDYGSGNSEAVSGYSLTKANNSNAGRTPSAWQFQGSNDGSTWTTLDTQTGQTFAVVEQTNAYSISNGNYYRYFRLNVTANSGATDGVQLDELKINVKASKGGGWAVTNTTAGEYIQWDQVNFSAGNYKFPLCYSSTAAHTVTLAIDGTTVGTTALPSTGNVNAFANAYVGTAGISAGTHDVKLTFVDGGPDVQWLFIKKYDPLMTFNNVATTCYLTAEGGGNSTMSSNRTTAGGWENFSVDDLTGAGTVNGGDVVNLQADDGLYVTAAGGGGSALAINRRAPSTTEDLTIVKVGGSGAIASGNQVAFRSHDGVHYLTVVNSTTVDFSGTSVGSAQTFTVGINTQ